MALGKQKSDSLLGIAIVAAVLFGVVMIYSASVIVGYTYFHNEKYFFDRQIIWAVAGLITMAITAGIDYRVWKKWAGGMLIVTFVLLLSVFLFSKGAINGAHRWIYIGSQGFQPSELAKLTFIVYLAAWLGQRKEDIKNITGMFLPFVAILVALSALMLLQPDFGTLSIMLVSAIAVYIVAGLTWQQAALGIGISVMSLGLILSTPYRRARVDTFLHGTSASATTASAADVAAAGTDYHITNIQIALGSGGWFGRGFGQSLEKRLFLPEPHTDSIFAIITEELGFVISTLLIALIMFIMYRGYRIAVHAPDLYGKLLATGITSWFAFQAFINLASMLHIVPLVGVPLPFISYGGTNLLISLAAAGILLNISRYVVNPDDKKTVKNTPAKRRQQAVKKS
jgi:cell division protein FtsW